MNSPSVLWLEATRYYCVLISLAVDRPDCNVRSTVAGSDLNINFTNSPR